MEIRKRVIVLSLISATVISIMAIYLYFSYGILDVLGMKLVTVVICLFSVFLLVLMAAYSWKNPHKFSMLAANQM